MSDIQIKYIRKINFSKPGLSNMIVQGVFPKYNEEDTFKQQTNDIAESILLNAPIKVDFNILDSVRSEPNIKWMMDELVAGSSVSQLFNSAIYSDDVDVYFKSINDAILFAKLNKVDQQVQWNLAKDQLNICAWVTLNNRKYNLIWGIKYNDAKDLISRFDIRACAMAYDPYWNKITMVRGSLQDAIEQRIVWQPTAEHISIHRLIKYHEKGFTIDAYQRVMFAELLKTKYNTDLELSTGYGESI